MSRPEFPTGCPLPSNCISRIRESQEAYDRDPERYEYLEKVREEERQREEQEELDFYRHQQKREEDQGEF